MCASSRQRITQRSHKAADRALHNNSICHAGPWRALCVCVFPIRFFLFLLFHPTPRRCHVRPYRSPARARNAGVNQVNDARWCGQRARMENKSGVNMWTVTRNDKHGHDPERTWRREEGRMCEMERSSINSSTSGHSWGADLIPIAIHTLSSLTHHKHNMPGYRKKDGRKKRIEKYISSKYNKKLFFEERRKKL